MTTPSAGIDRQRFHRLVAKFANPGVTDRELLHRFATQQDEAAFAALVSRHGPMVHAVGRRILGNAHDAEDVCQAAFLVLAQKASSQRWQPSVANWLHQTAHLLALKARRSTARRTRREAQVAARPSANPLAEMTGQELLAVLDEELLALPESLRAPLVLCYLEGATRDEAAERLRCPLSTLKKRLERGRDRLHAALVRRGLGLSTALLGSLLVGQSAASAPHHKTAETVLALAAGKLADGAHSARIGQLLNGGIGMTRFNKVTAALGVLLVGGLLAGAGAVASSIGEDKPVQPVAADKTAEPPAQPAAAGMIRVRVLDPEGKPLPGASVYASIWTDEKDFKPKCDHETDADGIASVVLPKTFTILRIWAGKKSHVTMFAGWEKAELTSGKGVPAEYVFRLETAVTAGGQVLDEKGKPVAGAKVKVRLTNHPKPAKSDGRVGYGGTFSWGDEAATTDAEGRWSVANVPDHPEAELSILVIHPDFVTDRLWTTKSSGVTTKMFREGTAAHTLKAGVIVRGQVTDPDGKPIKDAVIVRGDDPYMQNTISMFSTDADGRYRLAALPSGMTSITVVAPGWAPQLRKVDLKPDLAAQDFRMAAGKPVRLRVVDSAGKPVSKAVVRIAEWKGSQSIQWSRSVDFPNAPFLSLPRDADADGLWQWPSAPNDPVKVHVYEKGYAPLDIEVIGGSTDRTVTLKAEHRVAGKVTDAVTGKPIPAFTIIPVDVFGKDRLVAERYNAVAGKGGRFEYLATRTDVPLRLRIEAPGYRTQDGPEYRVGDDAGRTQDLSLKPSRPITGVIVDAAGKPAIKAEVFLATPTDRFEAGSGENHRAFTDAAGRFEFPDPGEPWAVFARTDAGVASAEFPADRADAGTLKLCPWASVRGRFQDGGKPVRGATVFMTPINLDGLGRPRLELGLETTTDADGRFEFPRILPGPVVVRIYIGPWQDDGFRSGPSVPLDLKQGERADLELGSGGATVSGKVKLTGKVPADLDCTYSLNQLVRREPGIAPPPEVAAAGFDARKGWRDAWHKTAEGRTYMNTLQTWFVKLTPDGSFCASGVPSGEYDLVLAVYAKPSGCLIDPIAHRVMRVTVTPEDATRGTLAIPEISAEVEPVPAVGDLAALSFTRTDGKDGSLKDSRGKYTVVHFWASWCVPCKKQLPALKKLHERFAANGLSVLSLSLDDDSTAWQTAIKSLDLPWSQGRLEADVASGVSSVPAYWLLDPAGKIVAKAYDLDELAKALEERIKPSRP